MSSGGVGPYEDNGGYDDYAAGVEVDDFEWWRVVVAGVLVVVAVVLMLVLT